MRNIPLKERQLLKEVSDLESVASKSVSLMNTLIDDVHSSGGLIKYSNEVFAPAAEPTWTDLGLSILNIQTHLESMGVESRLLITDVGHPLDED